MDGEIQINCKLYFLFFLLILGRPSPYMFLFSESYLFISVNIIATFKHLLFMFRSLQALITTAETRLTDCLLLFFSNLLYEVYI